MYKIRPLYYAGYERDLRMRRRRRWIRIREWIREWIRQKILRRPMLTS